MPLPPIFWLLCALLTACGGAVAPLQDPVAEPTPVAVVVVPLRGHLGTPELALCHRALREAEANGLKYVVFDLDNAGSLSDDPAALSALLDRLQHPDRRVPTVALVRGKAIQSAAHLALFCDQIFLAPGASLGAIAPTDAPLEELLGLAGQDAERIRLGQFRQELRQRLEQRKNKFSADALRLCEGMADPTLQLVRVVVRENGVEQGRVVTGDEEKELVQRGATIVARTELTRPVELSAQEAEDIGLSRGRIQDLEQLGTDHLLVDRRQIGVVQPTWSEHMVSWLEIMQPAFLVLGFVLLLLEVKTPGFGLPGLFGVLLLGLAMFYSYLVGLAEITEILLFFLGIAALATEIFLLPGTVVFGAAGFLALVFALVLSRQSFVVPATISQEEILLQNLLNLTLLFVLVMVVAALLWRILPKIPILRGVFLPPPDRPLTGASTQFAGAAGVAADPGAVLLGRTGRASTVLRPAGVAEFDGEPVDVVTEGDFVEAGAAVKVIAVAGNRIVVERAAPAGRTDRSGERGSVGLVLLLAVVGLALVAAEVIFVSFGAITILAGLALVSAVFLAFQESDGFGWSVLIGEALLAPVVMFFAFRLLPRTRFGKALILDAPRREDVAGQAAERGLDQLLHRTGVTLSALRPAGFARIDGKKVDVVTRGEMLDADCPVRVIDVLANRVVVARAIADPPAVPPDGSAAPAPPPPSV